MALQRSSEGKNLTKIAGNRWFWVLCGLALLYVISPVDFISELFSGPVGVVDDLGVVLGGLATGLAVKFGPPLKWIAIGVAVTAAALVILSIIGLIVLLRSF